MNLKDILLMKAEQNVQLSSLQDSTDGCSFKIGDEIGIECIDFSAGNIKCMNKKTNTIFKLNYDEFSGELEGKWAINKKDHYLTEGASQNRLLEEYKKYGSLIIAFDFDDTVYNYHKVPNRTYYNVIQLLKDLNSIGCSLVCWTGNPNIELVKSYLDDNGIEVTCIYNRVHFYRTDSRKVYANAYLDDRAGLIQVYKELTHLVNTVKKS